MPDYEIPEEGEYLWDWFLELLAWFDPFENGHAVQMNARDMVAWAQVTGYVVSPDEYAILREMSVAWRDAMNIEIQYSRELQADRSRLSKDGNTG